MSIRWDRDEDGVVTLTLDKPSSSANTMDAAFQAAFGETVDRLVAEKDTVKGVIITSAKKTFFAGGDLDELIRARPENRADLLATVTDIKRRLRTIETLGVPVVAAINGAALGGGLEIALAAHYRVVLDTPATKLGFPEVTLGLLPGAGGVVRSVRLLGLFNALLQLLLQGQQLRAPAAKDLGLVHEVVSTPEELLASARSWIAANPTAAQPYDTKGYKVPGGLPTSPSLAGLLPALPANLHKQLKGANLPAPHHILCAAVEGLLVDVDTAFVIEGRYFADLATGPISTNMIQAFWFDLNRINGGGSRPDGVPSFAPTKVGVIGAGMMGAGIAYVTAKAGIDVVLKDVSAEAAEKGKAYSQKILEKRRGTPEKNQALLARIQPTDDYADLAGCDFVIEAVFEDVAVKHRVLAEAAAAAPDALITSNTSTLPITELQEGAGLPDLVGVHFFSPVDKMPLIELIVGANTSPEAVAKAYDYTRAIGKTPIVVKDSRGFFTSRVFGTMVMEGAALLAEGLPAMSIERAALQSGFPAGPLTLLDEVTLTLPLKIEEQGGAAAEHPGLAVLRTLVNEHGRTGKAAGKGFFDWEPAKQVWPGLAEVFPPNMDGLAPGSGPGVRFQDAKDRLLFIMAVETARCFEEGVLSSVEDANIGSIMGIGFPPGLGGVAQFVDQYGVEAFVARADELADKFGERFRPPALLRDRAVAAGSLRAALA
ncbi:3-hydroxyacyl-CoA dehydrogenase NAD-binding domain-containing protein [Cryptosporangium phraense]|uniref:3-hydroxyacyl-CoA dehydrogenase NAD-binding domain-containing protein n=1 Tax=Cryptosporangium phraense TaxID=2593070 RepID=UPI001F0F9BE8|nr:3-hydroxyacyl-CoA dehydrogenase NAD-binding domain-containing protein [Cryptosporangium phraense]